MPSEPQRLDEAAEMCDALFPMIHLHDMPVVDPVDEPLWMPHIVISHREGVE